MRDDLRGLPRSTDKGPSHAGLAHERYAPQKDDEAKDENSPWRRWLRWMDAAGEPEDYAVAYRRWRESLAQWHTASVTMRASSRLLAGHGNASPTGVGLTLHHTWGVPVIPGSSLKGVLAAFLRASFEPAEVAEACRRLFGVPGDERLGQAASVGQVIFHDAPWVSSRGKEGAESRMLARDVLTVHQRSWYGDAKSWPNDYESPNPVAFLSVRPEGRFLVALSVAPGADAETLSLLRWAADRLCEALCNWGVGGKTAAGYGRLAPEGRVVVNPPRVVSRPSPARDAFKAWVGAQRAAKTEQRMVLGAFEAEWFSMLATLARESRAECAQALRALVKSPKLQERLEDLLQRLMGRA